MRTYARTTPAFILNQFQFASRTESLRRTSAPQCRQCYAPPAQPEASQEDRRPRILLPSEIRLFKAEKVLQVTFPDGRVFRFPSELLRVTSPAADSSRAFAQGRTSERYPGGRRHVGIMGVEPVGNYAIRVAFDDLHGSGIFTWDFLRDLEQNKFVYMREYLRSLRRQGLSRDSSTRITNSKSQ